MQEIADWLEKLGMSEYAQSFTEHKIDISVLGHLTDQDLKDIDIPLGHRRKILAAIGELTGAAATTPNRIRMDRAYDVFLSAVIDNAVFVSILR
jgi:hypothetical protein